MPVRHLPCGTPVNESERKAIDLLKSKLHSSVDNWVMLSNLYHHSHASRLSDEIDLVLIGSRGVVVAEIKHWDLGYIKSNTIKADAEAERINDKAINKLNTQAKFNGGVDLEDETGYYNTFYRQYDAQIGRFSGVDILSESTAGLHPISLEIVIL